MVEWVFMLVDVGHFWGVDKIGETSLPIDKKINFIVGLSKI